MVIANVDDQFERGFALAHRAVALNPNSSRAWFAEGWSSVYLNNLERASEAFDRILRINPLDCEQVRNAWFGKSWACQLSGRYEEGARWASNMVAQDAKDLTGLGLLAANLHRAGRALEADAVRKRIRAAFPSLTASDVRGMYTRSGTPEQQAIFNENVECMGLPE
jgi:adenylate cyclase